MSSTIQKVFIKAGQQGSKVLIPYITGGYPDMATCRKLLLAMDDSGADIIEVGIPFSDPLADGLTIQQSSQAALESGATPENIIGMMSEISDGIKAPLVIMTYYNPVEAMGLDRFAALVSNAGVSGVIVPDLPPEEAGPWVNAADNHGLDTIFLAAPTTSDERMKAVLAHCRGFLYYVTMTGVTGTGLDISEDLLLKLGKVCKLSPLPVVAGFGISTPRQAELISSVCDGVIVGSAIIRIIRQSSDHSDAVQKVSFFIRELKAVIDIVFTDLTLDDATRPGTGLSNDV